MASQLKELFVEIINERHLDSYAPYVKRDYSYALIPKKALTILGVRRAGKTTFLKQIWDDVTKNDEDSIQVYINFSDDRLADMQVEDLQYLIEAAEDINPNLSEKNFYIYLDEIQSIKKWELFADRLIRRKKTFVFLSGSSAKLLSKEIATEMRGRSVSIQVSPFSFSEYLNLKKIDYNPNLITSAKRVLIEKELDRYLQKGGFPETFGTTSGVAIEILQEYLHAIFYRDIVERHNVADPHRLLFLLKALLHQSGSLYTVNRITHKLKSLGYKIEKATVSTALQWFADAYCLESLPIFSDSIQKQNSNPKKIYAIDNGLVMAVRTVEIDKGHLIENLVFQKLKTTLGHQSHLFYCKTKDGLEVDFVLIHESQLNGELIQVCYDISADEVYEREIKALQAAAKELNLKNLQLIYVYSKKRKFEPDIQHIPLWQFLTRP
jgi:predicted AAA+ superfamily ATPase